MNYKLCCNNTCVFYQSNIEQYIISYLCYQPKVFTGNTDKNSIVLNDLPSIEARYIRVIPMEFKGQICMRIELCECEGKLTELHLFVMSGLPLVASIWLTFPSSATELI